MKTPTATKYAPDLHQQGQTFAHGGVQQMLDYSLVQGTSGSGHSLDRVSPDSEVHALSRSQSLASMPSMQNDDHYCDDFDDPIASGTVDDFPQVEDTDFDCLPIGERKAAIALWTSVKEHLDEREFLCSLS